MSQSQISAPPQQPAVAPPSLDLTDLVRGRTASDPSLRADVLAALRAALAEGREQAQAALESGGSGLATAHALSAVQDAIIDALFAFTTTFAYRVVNPTTSERLAVAAVGGYGRGQLAPGSDVDLLFLLPYKPTPWSESVVEFMLYMLWDLGLKVGYATRSVAECVRLSRGDVTIRTALLEARFLCGDEGLYAQLREDFWADVAREPALDFVEAKLAERRARHRRAGESRYVVEPNIKEGKGGLRDLHTLYWIAKALYRIDDPVELVRLGVLTRAEHRLFAKAEGFLWTVRCHLHFLTGRAEERLSFDVQPEMAERLGYTKRAGASDVERFMKHYFLVAKDVGDLTRIFCAVLEEQHKKRRPPLGRLIPFLGRWRRHSTAFRTEGSRLTISGDDAFRDDPVNLIRLFRIAQENDLDIHPRALQVATRSLKLIDRQVQQDPEANRLFLEILTAKQSPETALRRMNEAGVLGRFVPDFGRIVAQMQFNMYHHYTVDEHLIRAVGVLWRIESGTLEAEHRLATQLMRKPTSRAALYLAVFLHDIAKGRKGDHSEVGTGIAQRLGPRLGLTAEETETCAWLVRQHLLMSDVAQKRDIGDPKTVQDFAAVVRSPERLRLLYVLTNADIRAVGPGVFNGWKAQLLEALYHETEAVLSGGHGVVARAERVAVARQALRDRLTDWPPAEVARTVERHYDPYWLSLDADAHERHARLMRDAAAAPLTVRGRNDPARDATEITLYLGDHPGLFARITGALAVSAADILEAKIFTTVDGMALDTFLVQDRTGKPFETQERIDRLAANVEKTLSGTLRPHEILAERQRGRPRRERAFQVEPRVVVDNDASNTHTVIEVNGTDRPGLLSDLARGLLRANLSIGSAQIATYGETAVDVFYVKDLFGLKITQANKLKLIERHLLDALGPAQADKDGTDRDSRDGAERDRKEKSKPHPPAAA
jgi:[protein-PII] uridylyltransferase